MSRSLAPLLTFALLLVAPPSLAFSFSFANDAVINGIHKLIFSGSAGINVGASNPTTAETFSHLFASSAVLSPNLVGDRFSFVADESFVAGGTGDPSRFYVESVTFVPEPSTGLLLGLGLVLAESGGLVAGGPEALSVAGR